jgi:hypothetical protein
MNEKINSVWTPEHYVLPEKVFNEELEQAQFCTEFTDLGGFSVAAGRLYDRRVLFVRSPASDLHAVVALDTFDDEAEAPMQAAADLIGDPKAH